MKDEVSAIQHRQWQKVEEADTYGNGGTDAEEHPEQLFQLGGLADVRLFPDLVDDAPRNITDPDRAGHRVDGHLPRHDA